MSSLQCCSRTGGGRYEASAQGHPLPEFLKEIRVHDGRIERIPKGSSEMTTFQTVQEAQEALHAARLVSAKNDSVEIVNLANAANALAATQRDDARHLIDAIFGRLRILLGAEDRNA